MKIVCDACQAKYSISDDKVQGKVFKIRCKKCSNIIVVRGGASAAEPAPAPQQEKDTRVYDYGYEGSGAAPAADDQVWHVVINQDQVGPMTAAEVHERFARSEIDAETYVWREGFADWMPLAQVDQFTALAASPAAALGGGGGGGGHAAVAAMFGGGTDESGTVRSDPGDLFASASASASAGHAQDDDGGDLFGRKPAAVSPASAQANAKLRGERNENSVLFSLNNLAQLASDKPAPAPAASTPGAATGAAGGEGSGLIDIRSMASAYMGSTGGAAKPATASAIGSIDDLPVFGGGGFSEPAVIVPTARPANNNKLMYALIGTVGVLAVVAAVMVVVLLKSGDNKDEKKASELAAATDKKDDKKPDDKGSADKPVDTAGGSTDTKGGTTDTKTDSKTPDSKTPDTKTDAKTTDSKTDAKTVKKDTPVVKKDTTPKAPPSTTPVVKRDTTPKTPAATDTKKPKDEPVAKDDKAGGSCDEVSCVLNNYEGACCAKFKKGGGSRPVGPSTPDAAAKPHSDLPDGLDKSMISEGVSRVKARVMSCGDKSSAKGQVKVSVKVSPDGHVAGVTVKTTPDPALGSCVQAAMQGAKFAKTQNGGSFGYPFVF